MMGTSISKQKALLHRDREENAINTHSLAVLQPPFRLNSVVFAKWNISSKKKPITKMKKTLWKSLTRSFWRYMGCLSKFLSEHYEKLSTSSMGWTPPPKRLTNWHFSFLFFIVIKHAHHGADSAALLPGHMWNRIPCVFATRGCAESWFGIDQVEMKWSPPNCFHLDPFLSFRPPKSSLSLVGSSPNCRHKLIVASDGRHSACKPIAITLLSFHRRCSIFVVAMSSSHRRCCRCRHWCHCCCSCRCCRHCHPHHLCCCCHPHRHPCRRRCCCCCCRRCRYCQYSCFVVVVLVVLLGRQSKEFDQSKPRRYHPWRVDRATALGLAVGWPTALLGRHLVHDVVLSGISLCWAMGVGWRGTLRYPTVISIYS